MLQLLNQTYKRQFRYRLCIIHKYDQNNPDIDNLTSTIVAYDSSINDYRVSSTEIKMWLFYWRMIHINKIRNQ